jgi:hypothetical protein
LPPGCGCAGRAVALGKPFIAPDYASGCLEVPPIMAEAIAKLPTITTMSFPLLAGHHVIGAVTVGRLKTMSSIDYSRHDVRVAAQLARMAAPLLARAETAVEHARREQGASELSKLAGSLTKTLGVSAVCERLVSSVLALVRGNGAGIWNPREEIVLAEAWRPAVLRDPRDPRLERMSSWRPGVASHYGRPI